VLLPSSGSAPRPLQHFGLRKKKLLPPRPTAVVEVPEALQGVQIPKSLFNLTDALSFSINFHGNHSTLDWGS
jgi:hypothetical protein